MKACTFDVVATGVAIMGVFSWLSTEHIWTVLGSILALIVYSSILLYAEENGDE